MKERGDTRKNISGTMTEFETIEAFVDGCKQFCSAALELAEETNNPNWNDVAARVQALGVSGRQLFDMKAMTRLEEAMAINIKTGSIGVR